MREQIIVRTVTKKSKTYGEYEIIFVKPAAATVELCTFTALAKQAMFWTTRAYKGIYNTLYDPNDDYEIEDAMQDIQKTKLQTPLEMIHMLWLLNDVTRAFTHQLVRYRVGTAFVQESMRFFGMHKTFKVLVTHEAASDTALSSAKENDYSYVPKNTILDEYCYGAVTAIDSYVDLLGRGVPDQDARGVLPTNILTNIYFDCSLRTLQGIIAQRLCCQAQQGEWQPILREMRKLIAKHMGEEIEQILRAPYERGEDCGYRASFDRPCTWKKE